MPVDLISYLYAASVAAGGIVGYAKAGIIFVKFNNVNIIKMETFCFCFV